MKEILPKKSNIDISKIQRRAFLNGKGITPSKPFQLNLIFPNTVGERDDLRHIPNDYARSSLFTARNRRTPRKPMMHEKLLHYNEFVTIVYSGIELRAEDDELVWMQILSYGQNVPLGEPFEFFLKDLVNDIGWFKNGRNYDRVRESITRFKASEVLALNSKAYGSSGAISLIDNYESINDSDGKPTQYRVWIDPNLMTLFAGNTFTSHNWLVYRELSPVARRLADYIESHAYPYPLALDKFRQFSGSLDSCLSSWRRTVINACDELVEAKIVDAANVSKDDKICCVRT